MESSVRWNFMLIMILKVPRFIKPYPSQNEIVGQAKFYTIGIESSYEIPHPDIANCYSNIVLCQTKLYKEGTYNVDELTKP